MSKKSDLVSELISEIDKRDDDSLSSCSDKTSYDDGKSVQSVKVSKEFQENVLKFVKLDDLVRKKQQELSELKEQRKPCEQYILKYLDKVDQNMIEISDGKLRKNKSETKAALSQDIIKASIAEKVKDPQIVEEILKTMEDKRPLSTHINIKRTGGKKRTGKKKKD